MNGIGIVIIEAPMGEGKTEAALYLADHWGIATEAPDDSSPGVSPGVRGCYVALPTQATSNQMFHRVRCFLAQRYPGNVVNLQLVHGHAALSAEFQTMKANGDQVFKVDGVYSDGECAAEAMSVVAAEWFTHRKRGLLAPFGVGTVDQALMAVLQTKHVFVRLFGLAYKTVIIDEVHAYDAYMSKLLERLLEWLAALGSPVVLLSATLPEKRRIALLAAYHRGLSAKSKPATLARIELAKYPRITWATESETHEEHIEASADSSRTLQLKWVNGRVPELPGESCVLGEQLKGALAPGGCAAVICNTVNRAQQVFRALQSYFAEDELDLFHARFLFTDRDQREKRALVRFGKDGDEIEVEEERKKVERPRRFVLVATQVIEQSLDLDFDLMVTDLAPVDLVLQRSGRLHRHSRTRPPGLSRPVLWISEPANVSRGVPAFDDGTKAVYDAHILLCSWMVLHEKSAVRVPEEIEGLIETVYGERECPASPGAELEIYWHQTAKELSDKLKQMQTTANTVIIPPPYCPDNILEFWNKRLEEDQPEIHRSLQALTRLTGPTVSVVILRAAEQSEIDLTQPLVYEAVCFLLHHSVSLSHGGLVWNLLRQEVPDAWQRSALLCHHRLIRLDADGNWSDGTYQLRLDEELGVLITKLEGAGNA